MEDERRKVLQMLAEGKLTPEQANEFLDMLRDEAPSTDTETREPHHAETSAPGPLGKLTLDQAIQAKMFGVDADLIREMQDAGFPDLTFDQLLQAGMHGLDARFVREMRDAGFPKLTFDQLVQARMFGLDADFVREMREAGLRDLSFEKLAEMSMHGVDASYLKEVGAV